VLARRRAVAEGRELSNPVDLFDGEWVVRKRPEINFVDTLGCRKEQISQRLSTADLMQQGLGAEEICYVRRGCRRQLIRLPCPSCTHSPTDSAAETNAEIDAVRLEIRAPEDDHRAFSDVTSRDRRVVECLGQLGQATCICDLDISVHTTLEANSLPTTCCHRHSHLRSAGENCGVYATFPLNRDDIEDGSLTAKTEADRVEPIRIELRDWVTVGIGVRLPSLVNERVYSEELPALRVVVAPNSVVAGIGSTTVDTGWGQPLRGFAAVDLGAQ
jgi:hypothetical protein